MWRHVLYKDQRDRDPLNVSQTTDTSVQRAILITRCREDHNHALAMDRVIEGIKSQFEDVLRRDIPLRLHRRSGALEGSLQDAICQFLIAGQDQAETTQPAKKRSGIGGKVCQRRNRVLIKNSVIIIQ